MNNHQFTLEPYKGMKTRHVCPGCGKKDVFVLYIDQTTGEPLAVTVGRCNRETSCGYHYKPKQYFEDNKHLLPEQTRPRWIPPPPKPPKPPTFIDIEVLKASRADYDQNNFVLWLTRLFDATTVNNLIARYHLGTSKHWPGATVFWQIDQAGRVRTGKIMGYNATTGHRIKEPFNHITFVHSVMKLPDFTPKQCFFGEHLLKQEPGKPVAIVESEKTAIVASAYWPNFIWLAVGSLTNLNIEKCKPLSGRKIFLFPDLGGFEKWSQKAAEIQKALPGIRFNISDLLENTATETERQSGLDLCDYLIKFDWRTFTQGRQESKPTKPTKPKSQQIEKREPSKTNYYLHDETLQKEQIEPKIHLYNATTQESSYLNLHISKTKNCFAEPERPQPENWTQEITELERFFSEVQLPVEPIKVNRWTTITNIQKCVESYLATLKNYNGKLAFKAMLNDLKELKQYLITNKKNDGRGYEDGLSVLGVLGFWQMY